jgi:methionine-gamma-lyase
LNALPSNNCRVCCCRLLSAVLLQVSYPGLPHHPGHAVLARLLNRGYGYGGLMGVDMGSAAKGEAVSV